MTTWRSWHDIKLPQRQDVTRHCTGEEPVSLAELLAMITEVLGGQEAMNTYGDSVRFSRGYHFYWHSPETDEEMARRAKSEASHQERHDKWERETYARLREKFEVDAPINTPAQEEQ